MLCRKSQFLRIVTNPSSLINYLGYKGTRLKKEFAESAPIAIEVNALPYLMYWDIFKNYFANKQENNFYYVGIGNTVRTFTIGTSDGSHEINIDETTRILISTTVTIQANGSSENWEDFWKNTLVTLEGTANRIKQAYINELATEPTTSTVTLDKLQTTTGAVNAILTKIQNPNQNGIKLVKAPLENLDKIRDEILATSTVTLDKLLNLS